MYSNLTESQVTTMGEMPPVAVPPRRPTKRKADLDTIAPQPKKQKGKLTAYYFKHFLVFTRRTHEFQSIIDHFAFKVIVSVITSFF